MNDLYARDTSSKIKAVKLSTFKSGKYVGCYAPLGYRKSEADKHVLEIDPVTAPVVRHIFDLRLQGYGFRNIDNLIALVMLRCSDLKPALPGREA